MTGNPSAFAASALQVTRDAIARDADALHAGGLTAEALIHVVESHLGAGDEEIQLSFYRGPELVDVDIEIVFSNGEPTVGIEDISAWASAATRMAIRSASGPERHRTDESDAG